MRGSIRCPRLFGAGASIALIASALTFGTLAQPAASASASTRHAASQVLLVGTFDGVKGQFSSIQAAVNAAKPGAWILVAPGDYHETDDLTHPPSTYANGRFGSVFIHTPDIHLRGMNRNTVVVDGTKPGSPKCTANPADQEFGRVVGGRAVGRNGIVVFDANGVSVENLTACNFLSGSEDSGNGIWWNGGEDTEKIGLTGYTGDYLSDTTTYFGGESTASTYGIFSSDASGGKWTNIYASNQNDSGMYVGACQQLCNITISGATMEYNALGYSGTNSGGAVVVEHSTFDHNQEGFDTNTQINGDPPAPQNGACPNNGISPITHTHSCWVFFDNKVFDNNEANVPASGGAAAGPTGTGMTISGGRNDTIMDNDFYDNGAWGALFVPYPDENTPEDGQTCTGIGGYQESGLGCVIDPMGDTMTGNTFSNNGFFKNVSNADFGELTLNSHPTNCFSGNTAPDGSYPTNLEATEPTCTGQTVPGNATGAAVNLYLEALCDTGFGQCPAGANYPAHTTVEMRPLPAQPTMPNPCLGVPDNAWCRHGKAI
jgi:hypothetical protein